MVPYFENLDDYRSRNGLKSQKVKMRKVFLDNLPYRDSNQNSKYD